MYSNFNAVQCQDTVEALRYLIFTILPSCRQVLWSDYADKESRSTEKLRPANGHEVRNKGVHPLEIALCSLFNMSYHYQS